MLGYINYTSTLTKEWVVSRLPERPKDANKGTFGKVLAVAGSENFPGAAYLACAACYRVGAGHISLATQPSVKTIVSRKLPEVTFILLSEVYEKVAEYDVLLLGPGLGQDEKIKKFVGGLLKGKLPPAVIDGDGLNILSKMENWWDGLSAILTPHPGEMVRLTNFTVEEIQADRKNVAKHFAKKWGKVVVLKGANTVVASPKGEIAISPFANPALATAGTGDVLAGIIAGFSAQGMRNFNAACCGVYIHGLAAELVRESLGDAGMLASDLLLSLPKAIQKLKK